MEDSKIGNIRYCEEAQAVLTKTPPMLLHSGIFIVTAVLLLLLLGSVWIHFPEKAEVGISISPVDYPSFVTSEKDGVIWSVDCKDGQHVEKGDVLSLIDCSWGSDHILSLYEKFASWSNQDTELESLISMIPLDMLPSGHIRDAYQEFLLSVKNYRTHSGLGTNNEIRLQNAAAKLRELLDKWRDNHVLAADRSGVARIMQPWEPGQRVSKGETMFVIKSEESESLVGRAVLPVENISGISLGQQVQVHPKGFIAHDYGYLKGQISFISPVPDADGCFALRIEFPNGNTTSNGKKIPLLGVMQGNMDIVIRESSLLYRLFGF